MPQGDPSRKRSAIYTRKSSEEGLEQEFNSLQAQSEAGFRPAARRTTHRRSCGLG